MKTAVDRGAVMMEGEFHSLTSINQAVPGLAPTVHAWGKLDQSAGYFLIMDFLDLDMNVPSPDTFCGTLADMHLAGQSPTGKFGFHLPTCHGKHIQPNEWDESWCRFFTRLITLFFNTEIETHGHWKEYEGAFHVLKTRIIPSLLEPLQSEGRTLKPCLVHGDLWEENTGTNNSTGLPVVFDASAFYAHNEYELGTWRRDEVMFQEPHFEEYFRHVTPSEPKEQCEDRILLYSIKFSLAHSSGWKKDNTVRERCVTTRAI